MRTIKTMHPTMLALYSHLRSTRQVKSRAAISRILGISQQRLKNWESRGISKEGAIMVQDVLGVDGNALLKMGDTSLPESWRPADKFVLTSPKVEELMPNLRSIEWPFKTITAEQWRQFSDADRTEIENVALRYLRSREVTQSHYPEARHHPDGHPLSMAHKEEKAA